MSVSFESLIAVIKRSGLLSAEALGASVAEYQASARSPSAQGLNCFLVERGLLTPWQGEKLLDGKHKGFFLGKYRLLSLLGRGGMSTVYLAEHVLMKRLCAVKVLPWKHVKDTSFLERFHREAQAAASLDHPNIVRAYDVDHEVDGTAEIHFLVMEFVQGQNLYEMVQINGPLPPGRAANYMLQAACGLQHAHKMGMVHRDIKPGNLIVDQDGTLKVMDLGLARLRETDENGSLTVAHDERVLGTADYLSPEQAVDSHFVDERADLYSLGCTFYYLLTGRPPFPDGTLAQRLMAHQTKAPPPIDDEAVPSSLQVIVFKLMEKRPVDRYQSAEEFSKAMIAWMEANDPDEIPEGARSSQRLRMGRSSAIGTSAASSEVAEEQVPRVHDPAPTQHVVSPEKEGSELQAFLSGLPEQPPSGSGIGNDRRRKPRPRYRR